LRSEGEGREGKHTSACGHSLLGGGGKKDKVIFICSVKRGGEEKKGVYHPFLGETGCRGEEVEEGNPLVHYLEPKERKRERPFWFGIGRGRKSRTDCPFMSLGGGGKQGAYFLVRRGEKGFSLIMKTVRSNAVGEKVDEKKGVRTASCWPREKKDRSLIMMWGEGFRRGSLAQKARKKKKRGGAQGSLVE